MSTVTTLTPGAYPMRVVTRLTGLSSHTVRVWERRYGAVRPARTQGNARRYSEEDVRRLRLLRELTEQGHRISDLAALDEAALTHLARGAKPGDSLAGLRRDYLAAVEQLRGREASAMLSRAAALLDPASLATEVILPILRETGRRWADGSLGIAHEHLVSVHMRGLLDLLVRQSEPLPGAPVVVVATPSEHRHEFGALVGAQLAAARGYEALYLGTDVPHADLEEALRTSRASLCLLAIARNTEGEERRALEDSLERLSEVCEIWVGLPPGHALVDAVAGVRFLTDFTALDHALVERTL